MLTVMPMVANSSKHTCDCASAPSTAVVICRKSCGEKLCDGSQEGVSWDASQQAQQLAQSAFIAAQQCTLGVSGALGVPGGIPGGVQMHGVRGGTFGGTSYPMLPTAHTREPARGPADVTSLSRPAVPRQAPGARPLGVPSVLPPRTRRPPGVPEGASPLKMYRNVPSL